MITKKAYLFFFLLIMQIRFCMGQTTVVVPDANFRSFLQANFSSVMVGNLLDTVAAANVTGTLNCRMKSISDVSGIQYFKKLTVLNVSNNTISTLPALKNFINLQQLYADTNVLTSVPVLNTIPTLQVISFRKNNLTSFPSVTGLSNLTLLRCTMNNITSLPSLNGLTALMTLDCSENQLTQLPDLSTLVNLENIFCGRNYITVLPPVNNLTKLKMLFCGDNLLTTLPVLNNSPLLKFLRITGNQISQLPDLSFLTTPTQVYLDYNNFTFEDLIPVANNSNYSAAFVLFPQNKFGNYADTLIKKNGLYQFNLRIDGTIGTNTYQWFKNGNLVSTGSTAVFSVNNVGYADTGSYDAVVKNSHPAFVNDSLVSNTKKMKIAECFTPVTLGYSYENISCQQGFRVMVNTGVISGGTPPYSFVMTNSYNGESISSSSPVLSGIKEGNYTLTLQDALGCETAPLNCEFIAGADCDPVFSPNGDGVADTYYISTPGKARIFNKNGTMVHELITPAYWDGSDRNGGEVPSGYYAIIVNEKSTMNVSLMR